VKFLNGTVHQQLFIVRKKVLLMGKATQDLRKEHETILFVLKILDKVMAANEEEDDVKLEYYDELIYFFKIFADKCHHGKEENYLFEALVNSGFQKEDGPIAVMLQEHRQAREYLEMMSDAVKREDLTGFNDNAEQYRDLLKNHIDKEENIIFAMADKIVDEESQDCLFEKFEQYEEEVIGSGVHEKLHAMIDIWAEDFKVE